MRMDEMKIVQWDRLGLKSPATFFSSLRLGLMGGIVTHFISGLGLMRDWDSFYQCAMCIV